MFRFEVRNCKQNICESLQNFLWKYAINTSFEVKNNMFGIQNDFAPANRPTKYGILWLKQSQLNLKICVVFDAEKKMYFCIKIYFFGNF